MKKGALLSTVLLLALVGCVAGVKIEKGWLSLDVVTGDNR